MKKNNERIVRNSDQDELVSAALQYVRRGWPVIPLRGAVAPYQGRLISKGYGMFSRPEYRLAAATSDEATVREYWTKWPDANVGVATGWESKLVVLNVDPRMDGDIFVEELRSEVDDSSPTTLIAGVRDLRHFVFSHPGAERVFPSPTSARGANSEGVSISGDGGFFVAPPSRHGHTRARWIVGGEPRFLLDPNVELELEDAPEWLDVCRKW